MDSKLAFRHITKRVPIEKASLTYRLLSRELGIPVSEAKRHLLDYVNDESARERGVSAVYLLSGTLNPVDEAMDVEPPSSSLSGAQDKGKGKGKGKETGSGDRVKVKTVMLVPADELEAKRALFSPAPTLHVYALTPTRLDRSSFSTLTTCSLGHPDQSEHKARWKMAPDPEAVGQGYGGIVSADGEKKRATNTSGGKGKAPSTTASTAGTNGKGGISKGESSKASTSTAKDDKGKGKATASTTAKGKKGTDPKKKKKDSAPAARPIGALGGLFARSFPPKKASDDEEDDSEEEADDDDDEEEEEKPKKRAGSSVVPAKRKSTSPAVSRKPAPAPAAKKSVASTSSAKTATKPKAASTLTAAFTKKAPAKKAPSAAEVDIDLGDDDDDWAFDEEAMMELEREAAAKVEKNKKPAPAAKVAVPSSKKGAPIKKKENETAAEREKRELEEMMFDDGDESMQVDE
ncbi:hypothetical protein JCM10212_006048 [Sporobolomyces blumeae]